MSIAMTLDRILLFLLTLIYWKTDVWRRETKAQRWTSKKLKNKEKIYKWIFHLKKKKLN